MDPQAISGLVKRMPQFAVLFSLLALAAMGLPPFGVFTGFIGMLLTTALTSSVALLVMMIAWLAASWYILDMVQQLLFGRERPDLRYEDLRRSELASLLVVLLIVIALGIAPASLFGITQQPPNRWSRQRICFMESLDRSINIETRRMAAPGRDPPGRRGHCSILADADLRPPQPPP